MSPITVPTRPVCDGFCSHVSDQECWNSAEMNRGGFSEFYFVCMKLLYTGNITVCKKSLAACSDFYLFLAEQKGSQLFLWCCQTWIIGDCQRQKYNHFNWMFLVEMWIFLKSKMNLASYRKWRPANFDCWCFLALAEQRKCYRRVALSHWVELRRGEGIFRLLRSKLDKICLPTINSMSS